MANEAYRAVFLRVHPTGKMVLSLTTEADGHEGEYARLVADELGVPALDVKVVPADTDRFGTGHGFNTSPVAGDLGRDRQRDRQDPRQGPAAGRRRADAAPDAVQLVRRRVRQRRGSRLHGQDDRRPAMYAHGTGALPPGVEGGLDAQTVYQRLTRPTDRPRSG